MIPTPNTRLNKIERQLVRAVRKVDRQYLRLGRSDARWTRAVKNAIGMLGNRHGHQVYGAQCKYHRNGEWMVDLAWSVDRGEVVQRLPFVMESEWDPNEILWDFAKLVVVRADIRMMVFWGKSAAHAEHTLQAMVDQIRRFVGTAAGDRYLFCYWTDIP